MKAGRLRPYNGLDKSSDHFEINQKKKKKTLHPIQPQRAAEDDNRSTWISDNSNFQQLKACPKELHDIYDVLLPDEALHGAMAYKEMSICLAHF